MRALIMLLFHAVMQQHKTTPQCCPFCWQWSICLYLNCLCICGRLLCLNVHSEQLHCSCWGLKYSPHLIKHSCNTIAQTVQVISLGAIYQTQALHDFLHIYVVPPNTSKQTLMCEIVTRTCHYVGFAFLHSTKQRVELRNSNSDS